MFCLIINDVCFVGDPSDCVGCPAFDLYVDTSQPDDSPVLEAPLKSDELGPPRSDAGL